MIRTSAVPLEIKAVDESGAFSGYASVFGVEDSYGDVISKGAFTKSLNSWRERNMTPAMLWQHKPDEPIGKWVSLVENERGLLVEGRLELEVQRAKEAYALLKSKALNGLSIGFNVAKSTIDSKGKRTITEIDLWEISPVVWPANKLATVEHVREAIRSGEPLRHSDIEQILVNAGLTHTQARQIATGGLKSTRLLHADERNLIEGATSLLEQVRQGVKAMAATRSWQ